MDVFQSAEARAIHGIDIDELQELCRLFLGAPVDESWARKLVEILRSFRLGQSALVAHLLRMYVRQLGVTDAAGGRTGEPGRLLKEHPDYTPTHHFGSAITLVVPTIDSESWIQEIIDFYESIALRPLYVVDSRTRDGTCEILARAKQNWIKVSSKAARVESLLPGVLGRVNRRWVLRLDDDELPSPGLLDFCDEAVDRDDAPVWGFPRLCLRWQPGRTTLDYSTFLTLGPAVDMDPQFRLFRADSVILKDEVHTPGFDSAIKARAPSGALILHFNWVLRTLARRRDKAALYAAQAGDGLHPLDFLYEDVPEEWHLFEPLEHPRLLDVARRIHQRSS
jgi:hypothetical protein